MDLLLQEMYRDLSECTLWRDQILCEILNLLTAFLCHVLAVSGDDKHDRQQGGNKADELLADWNTINEFEHESIRLYRELRNYQLYYFGGAKCRQLRRMVTQR